MNILRRLPLSRLLLACALALALGVSATALAFAVGAGPTPPPKPLAEAVHDALAGARSGSVEGISANVTLTDNLLEGANLASGGHSGELTSSPLVTGASGRLWIAGDGHVRLELQSQRGDTQIISDGRTVSLYDAATNTLYRYTPEHGAAAGAGQTGAGAPDAGHGEVPSVAKIEEAISRLQRHAHVSGATPTDVAGQPAYTVRLSPREGGSLLGGVELSFDAANGVPLRAAVYSSSSSSPVIELAASQVSYGPVAASVFQLSPPANAKVQELHLAHGEGASGSAASGEGKPTLTTHGHGPTTVLVLASPANGGGKNGAPTSGAQAGAKGGEALEGLPKVTIDGASASELRTELGTVLDFERGGVRYLLAGLVAPAQIEAVARGL